MANSIGSRGTFVSGDLDVTTAGTAEALGTGLARSITIIAKDTNTGRVYLGGSDVASTTSLGLAGGDSVDFSTKAHDIDLSDTFVDVSVSGEGVDFYMVR
jgi:hypothetical protein